MATQHRYGQLPRGITPNQVIASVADYYNIPLAEMLSPSRESKEGHRARALAAHFLHQYGDIPLSQAAQLVCRERTTIFAGARMDVPDQEAMADLEGIVGIRAGQST